MCGHSRTPALAAGATGTMWFPLRKQWEDMIRSWLPCSGKAIGGKGSCQEAGEEVTVVIQEGIP